MKNNKRTCVVWSDEELKLLKNNFSTLCWKDLVKLFPQRSRRSIEQMGNKLGIKREKKYNFKPHDKIGELELIRRYNDVNSRGRWECQCSCGKMLDKREDELIRNLNNNKNLSCGHELKPQIIDIDDTCCKCIVNTGFFYIDKSDEEFVSSLSWHVAEHGYIVNSKHGYLHRLLMNPPSDMEVDHKNGIKEDNRRINLRICTNQDNSYNTKPYRNSKSGIKGVYYNKKEDVYIVQIRVNKKVMSLGRFKDINEAKKVRVEAEQKYHKEYAYSNRENYGEI